ncbi:response regulator [Kaustia mangrovi]|uniref:Response regulator n=1 Tax=Kaustia mangrovi TaxID=2593653 RepID=A0A7S8C3F2_9HYPH|nr:response regulator [Kaustia mangrovi]QPC42654.1 response regulator [Kaustia mangrovi]
MKPTILIVEDDKAVRESLRMVLEVYGYTVEEFATGEDLIERAEPVDGACIILDIHLPGASGIETLERLRAHSGPFNAILVSARATDRMQNDARRLHALALFSKPVDIDRLLGTISALEQ